MVAAIPASLPSEMPKIMKPMWLTRVKESMRLISTCAMAPRMPTTIVSSDATIRTSLTGDDGNSSVSVRMMA